MKILFVCPYPLDEAPSQRFRFEQYFNSLNEKGVKYDIKPFINSQTWKILYKKGHLFKKVIGILSGFRGRFALMFASYKYNYIFIHREASPIGPPFFEWFVSKVWRKKIIYDFDDAIWLPNTSSSNRIVSGIKHHSKVRKICGWAHRVSVGNSYLKDYARSFNDHVVINPTTIDTENLHNPSLASKPKNEEFTIGWTGTHSTLRYLKTLLPVLDQLNKEVKFRFLIISNQDPKLKRKYIQYIPWNKDTEIADLSQMDVGVMPLEDDQWARGKCGFKALQYMALEIPALVSPVGVNKEIVDHGENGFICHTPEDWHDNIRVLMANRDAIKRFGKAGREKVIHHYSVSSNTNNYLSLFDIK